MGEGLDVKFWVKGLDVINLIPYFYFTIFEEYYE